MTAASRPIPSLNRVKMTAKPDGKYSAMRGLFTPSLRLHLPMYDKRYARTTHVTCKKGKRCSVSRNGDTDVDGIFEILANGNKGSCSDGGLDNG